MDILAGDITPLIFQLSVKHEPAQLTLDKQMLGVIQELDGKRTVGLVARNLGLPLDKVREIIAQLLAQGIIGLVNQSVPMLKEDFFIYLADQLSLATGPMAEVLIDEAIDSLGYSQSSFPKDRVQELIDLLTPKIFREEKRAVFKENLYKKILSK